MKFVMLTLALFAFAFSVPAEIEKPDFSMPAEIEKPDVSMPAEIEKPDVSMPAEIEKPDFSMPAEIEKHDFSMPAEIEKRADPRLDLRPFDCRHKADWYNNGTTEIQLPDKNHCVLYQCILQNFIVWQGNCTDRSGECREVGSTWDEGKCTTFKCEQNYSLSSVKEGCEDRLGNCHNFSSTWKEGNCSEYSCDKYSGIVAHPKGCEHNGICHEVGSKWWSNPTTICAEYTCNTSYQSELINHGCEHNGTCHEVGSMWVDNLTTICIEYTCNTSYQSEVLTHGCYHDGHCRSVKSKMISRNDCSFHECIFANGQFNSTFLYHGCYDNRGNCLTRGAKWIVVSNGRCLTYECDKDKGPVILKGECEGNGTCHEISPKFFNNPTRICMEYTCNTSYQLSLVTFGCYQNRLCHRVYARWQTDPHCTEYECKLVNGRHIISIFKHGCNESGECHYLDSKWARESYGQCFTHHCHKDNNITISQGGCYDNGQCRPVNSRWIDYKKCNHYQCIMKNNQLINQFVYAGCLDRTLKCHVVGTKWWEVSDTICWAFMCNDTNEPSFLHGGCKDSRNKCRKANSTWWGEDCSVYMCDEKYRPQRLRKGCKEDNGKCHEVGFEWWNYPTKVCKVFKCNTSHEIEPIDHGCYKDGKCFRANTRWVIYPDCFYYECKLLGEFYMSKFLNQGCMDSRGKCRYVGSKWAQGVNGECFTHHCHKSDNISSVKGGVYSCWQSPYDTFKGAIFYPNCACREINEMSPEGNN